MPDNKLKYSELIFTGIFMSGIFIFFTFFYSSHLHFEEQVRLFLLTGDYFISTVRYPGGFAGYTGDFLTQFWHLPVAGPVIITSLLFAMQQLFRRVLVKINPNGSFFILSFLPSLNCAMILCDEFYPVSAVTGMLVAILSALIYTGVKGTGRRFISGIVLLFVTYFLAGGSFIPLMMMMVVHETVKAVKSRRATGKGSKEPVEVTMRFWQSLVYILIVILIPLGVKGFLIMEPLNLAYISEFYYDLRTGVPVAVPVLFALPAVAMIIMAFLPSGEKVYHRSLYFQYILFAAIVFAGFRQWTNFGAERTMRYDYLVRNERWDDLIEYAEKKPPRNNLSLAMLNLALAKTGRMGDMMFRYPQSGTAGLFIPFTREREYVAPMLGNEILFHLGLVNASQEYTFESMETIPDYNKGARHLKRLAETNLINGNYEVSRKYINILKKTMFYSKWARQTEMYLGNEEMINNHPAWGAMRKMQPEDDFFFRIENIEAVLNMLVRDNPQNKVAFQYLMGFYLVNKDLRNVMNTVPKMNALGLDRIPSSWEEAIMYVVGLSTTNLEVTLPFKVSRETKERMKAYAQIYTTNPNAKPVLAGKFPDTYWYYLHFKNPDLKNSN